MIGLHGTLLMVTALVHILVGLLPITYKADWSEFLKSGFWNTVWITEDRKMAAFWFVIAGPMLFIGGLALYELERQGVLPPSIGWAMLSTAVVGGVMMPKSGFTILLMPQSNFLLSLRLLINNLRGEDSEELVLNRRWRFGSFWRTCARYHWRSQYHFPAGSR